MTKALKFLKTANLLIETGDFDSAVSRIYYSLFHATKGLLKTKGVSTKSHTGTHAQFFEHFIKTKELPQEMMFILHLSYESRQLGDYEIVDTTNSENARSLLKKAEYFMEQTKQYLSTLT
ncbi:HEPN domain-containing protein [Deltaproteobacteria bacterium TL4]